jgi:plastocyanin
MRRKAVWTISLFTASLSLAIVACGGDDGPTTPTNPGGGGGGGGTPSAMTITIGADGRVSPASVTVPVGSRVTFTNSHNVQHDMSSDPHPEHTMCPEITVGNLQPGQSRQTQNLTVARTCGYHDHNQPTNTGLIGTIRIQ